MGERLQLFLATGHACPQLVLNTIKSTLGGNSSCEVRLSLCCVSSNKPKLGSYLSKLSPLQISKIVNFLATVQLPEGA